MGVFVTTQMLPDDLFHIGRYNGAGTEDFLFRFLFFLVLFISRPFRAGVLAIPRTERATLRSGAFYFCLGIGTVEIEFIHLVSASSFDLDAWKELFQFAYFAQFKGRRIILAVIEGGKGYAQQIGQMLVIHLLL